MRHLPQLYRAQFRTTFADQVQYRGALAIWAINLILEPVIYLAVWSTVAASQGGAVDGFGARDFAAYFIAAMVVNHASVTWIMWEFEFWIRQGTLSPRLLRPVHPIHQTIADNLTFKILNLIVVLPAAAVLALVFHANFTISPWTLAAFVPALLLAAALRFAIEWTLALAAFWITRVGAINQLYFVVFLFLSGQMAPLALLPSPIATLAAWLPFYRMLGFPVELLLGHLTPTEALWGIGAQAAWLAIFVVALNVLWARGVRQYSAVGA
ncbi:MAG: ABC-2 family transporter protein [Thermomicrobiales bacterium]|nr:ABC-2 family transporter protein [Thermomicrobiales bacterium]